MKLFYANTSPYARKCRIVAAEKGLDDRIDFVLCNPFEAAPALKAVNPLSKVPSLVRASRPTSEAGKPAK